MSEPAFKPPATFEEIVGKISEHQNVRSAASIGERLSAAILEKTEDELVKFADELDNDAGNTLINGLVAAEDSLKHRHDLVTVAMCRLYAVLQQDRGGANG